LNALFDFTDKPNQRAFFHSRARNVGFWGGYGNGKTYAGCGKGYLHSIYYPGNVGLVGRKTYPALNSTTRESFLSLCRKQNGGTLDPGPIIAGFNKSENLLRFRNGSIVFFRTLDEVEKLRSLNLGWALIDQAEEVDEEIYLELNGRIRYWNEERISEFTREHGATLEKELGFVPVPFSQLICVGNPAPKPWVRREFKDNEKKQNAVFQASTLENKKFLPLEYVSELEARYPKEWVERFVNGSWDTMMGQIYKDFNYEEIHSIPPFDIPKHWRRFIALDHGIVNPTAVVWGALDEVGNVFIYREYYVAGKGVDQHAEAIKEICQADGSTPTTNEGKIQIYMDYAIKGDYDPHGISAWEHYNRRGIFGLDADKRVQDGIQNVQVYLHPKETQVFPPQHPKAGRPGAPRLFIFDGCCPWLVREFKAYEWKETREGQNAPEEPKKHFDHLMDAIRYLCQAIKHATSAPEPQPKYQDAEHEKLAKFTQYVFTREEDEEGDDE